MRKWLRLTCFFLIAIALFQTTSTSAYADGETYISETAYQACVDYGSEYGICPELIMAVVERESGGKSNAVSPHGALGLMQIIPKWNYDRMNRLGVSNLYDERENILCGTDLLAEYFEKYEDPTLVLMCYNQGEYEAVNDFDSGIYSKYATSILLRSEELERLHGK